MGQWNRNCSYWPTEEERNKDTENTEDDNGTWWLLFISYSDNVSGPHLIYVKTLIYICLWAGGNGHLPPRDNFKANCLQFDTNKSQTNVPENVQCSTWPDGMIFPWAPCSRGDIPHVFYSLPDVRALRTRFISPHLDIRDSIRWPQTTHTHHMRSSQQRGHLRRFM